MINSISSGIRILTCDINPRYPEDSNNVEYVMYVGLVRALFRLLDRWVHFEMGTATSVQAEFSILGLRNVRVLIKWVKMKKKKKKKEKTPSNLISFEFRKRKEKSNVKNYIFISKLFYDVNVSILINSYYYYYFFKMTNLKICWKAMASLTLKIIIYKLFFYSCPLKPNTF
jgi:hypothetical protein